MAKKGLRLIVVGAGKVGDTLVNRLADEGHNLVIIDKNEERLTQLANLCDCMCITGSGASHEVLVEAGISDTDLFISVTESDELNLLCCTIAKQFNKNLSTIARVRNPDYISEVNYLRSKLGIEMIINPEYEAAVEASRLLFLPAAISVNSFAHGQAELVKIQIPEGNILDGKTIAYLGQKIPNGSFELKSGDIISYISTRKTNFNFLKSIGFNTRSVKSSLIVGGGTCAYYLSDLLIKSGIDVTIIEKDSQRCEDLCDLLPKATILKGEGTNESLLEEAGIKEVDSVIALTGLDEENIMLALHTKAVSTAKAITKINKITFTEAIESLKLGSVIYPRYICSEAIIAYVRARNESRNNSNIETLYHLADHRVEALEFEVKENSPVTGTPLFRLSLKKNLLIACINRDGRIIIPSGQDTIEVGDEVTVVTTHSGFRDLQDILA